MLALFVSGAAGYYYYTLGGIPGLITGVAGYILFVVWGYIRAGIIARDPVQRLQMEVGRPSGWHKAERFVCAIVLPLVGASVASLVIL